MIAELLAAADYPRLKSRLGGLAIEELRPLWEALPPLKKLAVFKLLNPERAMSFYEGLGFDDKYLLLCGFEPGSIAPLTEDLPPGRRALFEKLGPDAYQEMLRRLA